MISLEQVTKRFGSSTAVSDISFEMETGSVTGFLGPNGAGKTTTMRMITGYLEPDSGRVLVGGKDHKRHGLEIRQKCGYLPETSPLYGDMTVLEYLELAGGLRGLRGRDLKAAIARMVAVCDLGKNLKKNIDALSKGFRQRVGLAQAMIHDPEILILDEPTTGLDPNQIRYIKDLIKALGREKTLMLSTHILHQAPELCDRILVITEGRLVFDGTPREMAAQSGPPKQARLSVSGDLETFPTFIEPFSFITGYQENVGEDGFTHYLLDGQFTPAHMDHVFQKLAAQPWQIGEWAPEPVSLDGVFAQLTGEAANANHLTRR